MAVETRVVITGDEVSDFIDKHLGPLYLVAKEDHGYGRVRFEAARDALIELLALTGYGRNNKPGRQTLLAWITARLESESVQAK